MLQLAVVPKFIKTASVDDLTIELPDASIDFRVSSQSDNCCNERIQKQPQIIKAFPPSDSFSKTSRSITYHSHKISRGSRLTRFVLPERASTKTVCKNPAWEILREKEEHVIHTQHFSREKTLATFPGTFAD